MRAPSLTDQSQMHCQEDDLPRPALFETGNTFWADTSSKELRNTHKFRWEQHEKKLQEVFLKSSIDVASIRTDEDYIKPLMTLFKKRSSR